MQQIAAGLPRPDVQRRRTPARLVSIYKGLGTQLGSKTPADDITVAFAAAGLALLLGAGIGSLRWSGRLP